LVAACRDCATLATDLRAIARATAEVPPARRPRDFFIRPADADRLRPRGLRRIAAAFSGSPIRLARPLAGGLMMVGFAGLLVASLPGLGGSAALAPADQRLESVASPALGSEIQGQSGGDAKASAEPYATDRAFAVASRGAQASVPPPAAAPGGSLAIVEPRGTLTDAPSGPSPLVLASVGLVAIGAGLFLLTLLRRVPGRS
ncbi:MAG TPA: hypothetical protein VGQ58_12455, partial [Candidatus Limnocylindrales bacterium]|nr:hypothetical protein [Candidatus Limnocylindrales bacterium]